MTKLEAVLERIAKLPPEEQDWIAVEIEFMLDHGAEPILTPEQEAELERRLADPNRTYVPHEQVVAALEKKYGK